MSSNFSFQIQQLREQAESRLKNNLSIKPDPDHTIYELQVHQTELEVQHEELQRANQELQQLYQEYWDLYEFAPCGYATLNDQGIISRINQAGINLLGLPPFSISYLGFSRFIIPEHQNVFYTKLQNARQTHKKQSLEVQLVSTKLWVHIDIQANFDQQDRFKQWHLALTDVSAQKELESAREQQARLKLIEEQAEKQRLLNLITYCLHQTLDLQEIVEQAVAKVLEVFPVTRVILAICDENREIFDLVRIGTSNESGHHIVWSNTGWDYSQLQAQFQKNPMIVIDDVAKEELIPPILEEPNEAQSLLATGIWYQNSLQGIISLQSCEQPYHWQETEKQLLQQITDQLAIALQQARSYHNLQVELGERTRLQEQSHYEAIHDELTGLPNRKQLMHRLQQLIQGKRGENQGLWAVLFLDLNGFKEINDMFGHRIGDQVLVRVAQRLQKTLRNKDVIARLGGDEFVIILENLHNLQGAIEIANRIHQALTPPMVIHEMQLQITTSIGILFNDSRYTDSETLLHDADLAMYQAKDQGAYYVIVEQES